MYAGLAISLALHMAILFWAVLSLQAAPDLDLPDVPTIEAELITISEFTRLKQGDPNAKKLEAKAKENEDPKSAKKEAPKPKPELAPPPPAEDPIADKIAALTPPPPSPEELKKKREAEQKALEKKKAEEKAKADAKKKAEDEKKKKAEAEKKRKEAAKKKADAERKRKEAEKKLKAQKQKKKKDFAVAMKALLDKTPEKRGAPRSATEPTEPTDYAGPTAGERQGSGSLLTAREEDLLKSRIDGQIRSCWRLPGGGGGIETTIVVLSWRMNKDGTLIGQPKVINGRSDPVFSIAAEAAIRAVNCAAPFSLPPDKYDAWKYIDQWKFDPSAML